MLQGDFNHMANIITVLFEQIICKSTGKESRRLNNDVDMDDESKEFKIFENNEITKYGFFETVYQITSVLGQTNPCLISSLIMIDRFAVKNPNFTITRDNIQRLLILAGMDIRSYNLMETLFINMVDYEFNVTESYYKKYCNSLYSFIQGMQRQLRSSYDEILREAYMEETQTEIEA